MAEDHLATNGEGYRITLGVVYTQQQAMLAAQESLKADFRVLTVQLENERKERAEERKAQSERETAMKTRVEKLEGRLNGILITLGSGAAVGMIAYFQGRLG
jgi:hypothetical protein